MRSGGGGVAVLGVAQGLEILAEFLGVGFDLRKIVGDRLGVALELVLGSLDVRVAGDEIADRQGISLECVAGGGAVGFVLVAVGLDRGIVGVVFAIGSQLLTIGAEGVAPRLGIILQLLLQGIDLVLKGSDGIANGLGVRAQGVAEGGAVVRELLLVGL